MKVPSVITVTMRKLDEPFPWYGDIEITYEPPNKTERFLVRGHCPINVLGRCSESIERKLKQNETQTLP